MTEASHLQWGAEHLWQALQPLLPGLSVEIVARCESTNTALLERARRSGGRRDTPVTGPAEFDGGPHSGFGVHEPDMPYGRRSDDTQPCLLVAEQQTRGRGRMGRVWQSSSGASLTFSIALPLQPRDWSGMSLAVGVALAEALDPRPDGSAPRIGLKWPNDLLARGRKLGGILVEVGGDAGGPLRVVVGLGINVAMPAAAARDIDQPWCDLAELSGAAPDRHAVCVALLDALLPMLARFEREGLAPWRAAWERHDVLAGRAVRVVEGDRVHEGVAAGIADDGALRLRGADGERRCHAGEASLRAA